MKNRTLFKQEYIDAAMRASNFDNNKYKIFKMIYTSSDFYLEWAV